MKKLTFLTFILGLAWLLIGTEDVIGGRGRGGGGGGGRGGGGGAIGGGGRPVGGAVSPFDGGSRQSVGGQPATPIVGSGGARPGGGAIGGGAPGGKQIGGGPAQGPAGKGAGSVGSGAKGSIGEKYSGGATVGPKGGAAGKSDGGAGVANRAAVANGAYGAAAGRTGVAAGRGGTYYRSTAAVRAQGVNVRTGVANYPCFRPGWYTEHPGAWFAAGWAANAVWRGATYAACSSYCGVDEYPIYYDYGENVAYQDDGVYFDGEKAYTTEEYIQKADTLADAGRQAKVTKDEDWLPLGVFAMVQGEETKSNHIFQLSINKQGVIRGNYYDAVTDSTSLVYGSVDKKTQRAAWTVGDRKSPVYEAGIANLTKDETTMVVHYSKERSEQYALIRIEEPEMKDAK